MTSGPYELPKYDFYSPCCAGDVNSTKTSVLDTKGHILAKLESNNHNSTDTASDVCPPYFCSIAHTSTAFLKHETLLQDQNQLPAQPQSSHSHHHYPPSPRNPWSYTNLELRGTILLLTPSSSASHIRALIGRRPSQEPLVYSLQTAKVGVAPDYEDKAWVIRVRIETKTTETTPSSGQRTDEVEQFVLAMNSREEMVEWVQKLELGIGIAKPIDGREMPDYCPAALPRLGP